jgi:hypothetical protein
MSRKRPIGFIIIAIANFVVAVCFIVCGVCANISDSQKWFVEINGVRWDEKKLNAHLKEKAPAYTPVKITGIVLGYGVCVGLILAGAGLLYGGLISKIFALLVFVAGLFHHFAMIIYQLVFVHPAINQFFDQMPPAIIVGRAAAEVPRWTSLFPGYLSISWWVLGCLFYLVAGLVVAISSTADDDDQEQDSGRKRVRDYDDEDEDDDDEDDEDEERRRRKRKRKR